MRGEGGDEMLDKFDIKHKIRWVLIDLLERKHISDSRLADDLGCTASFIRQCKNMHADLAEVFITRLSAMYGVRPDWIYSNEGEPYETESAPDKSGEAPRADNAETRGKPEFKIPLFKDSELIIKVVEIMEAGGPRAEFLEKFVQQLEHAVRTSNQNMQMERELMDLRDEIKKMKENPCKQ